MQHTCISVCVYHVIPLPPCRWCYTVLKCYLKLFSNISIYFKFQVSQRLKQQLDFTGNWRKKKSEHRQRAALRQIQTTLKHFCSSVKTRKQADIWCCQHGAWKFPLHLNASSFIFGDSTVKNHHIPDPRVEHWELLVISQKKMIVTGLGENQFQ